MRRIVAGALLAGLAPTPLLAASATATANAVAIRPLTVVKIRDLEFGNLLAGSTAGTVALNAFTGVRTTTGGTVAVGGLFQRAEFITYGGPSALVVIFVGAAPVLTRVGGGATMTVSGLGYNGPLLRNLTTAGLIEMQVGGTLAVAANQMPGRYVGTFDLNVFYF